MITQTDNERGVWWWQREIPNCSNISTNGPGLKTQDADHGSWTSFVLRISRPSICGTTAYLEQWVFILGNQFSSGSEFMIWLNLGKVVKKIIILSGVPNSRSLFLMITHQHHTNDTFAGKKRRPRESLCFSWAPSWLALFLLPRLCVSSSHRQNRHFLRHDAPEYMCSCNFSLSTPLSH